MNYRRLTIGQMAEINRVSCQTLRHYDAQGLLVPAVVDGKTGYRYYNIMQSARLDMIQYMKSLDIGLGSIKAYLDSRDTGKIVDLLVEKQADTDRHILRLDCDDIDGWRGGMRRGVFGGGLAGAQGKSAEQQGSQT